MHKWDEMRQENAQEELTAQVVGMSEAGTTGETMPEKKVPEVENEIGETNAIKETEYVSAIDFFSAGFPESGRRCLDSDSGNSDQLSGGLGEGQ